MTTRTRSAWITASRTPGPRRKPGLDRALAAGRARGTEARPRIGSRNSAGRALAEDLPLVQSTISSQRSASSR